MKKAEVKIGGKYYANVSGNRCEIRIDAEKPRGGWDATNLATGKKILIKSAQRLQGEVGEKRGRAKVTTEGNVTVVEAALKVLSESSEPMNAQELITAMEAKGYWTSPGGKTPHATLYSAILRDLAKGDDSKFVKTERGRFTVRG